MVSDDESQKNSQTETYTEKAWLFETLKTVKAGQSFGLQVLVQSKPFAVTAICSQKVELVSLSKDNY